MKWYKLYWLRFKTLRQSVKNIFLFSIFFILLIELVLKNWSAPNQEFFRAGDMFLKLCYSCAAATFFYFMIQHIPREEKKAKAYRFVSNKTASLYREINYLFENLGINLGEKNTIPITKQLVQEACNKVNPQNPVYSNHESATNFPDWFEYLTYKTGHIKDILRDLLLISDSIDTALMEQLLMIEDITYNNFYFDRHRIANDDMMIFGSAFYELYHHMDKAWDITYEKYQPYFTEYKLRWKPKDQPVQAL